MKTKYVMKNVWEDVGDLEEGSADSAKTSSSKVTLAWSRKWSLQKYLLGLLYETQLYRKTELCFIPKTIEINHATIGNWNVLPDITRDLLERHHVTNSEILRYTTSLSNTDIHSFCTKRFRVVMQRHNSIA